MAIHHVALWTDNLSISSTFLLRYFNAKIGPIYASKRRPGFTSCFAALPRGETQIELMYHPGIAKQAVAERIGFDHIAISLGTVDAVDALAARCDADGLLISAPRVTGDGFYEAIIAMPDGTRIEITV